MQIIHTIKGPVAILLLLLVAVTVGCSAFLLSDLMDSFAYVAINMAGAVTDLSLIPENGGMPLGEPVTFLVFGIDAGEWVGGTYRPGPGRADTIILIKAFPDQKKASLLSIPRDTLVVIPGRPGDDKINHAYAFGQTGLLVETVEIFTGTAVDYYIGLNYLAFKDIVDYLGGVEFAIDRVIELHGLRLEPGLQVLDGDEAFAVVSTRQDPLGDIDRVRRQQRFIKAVAGEVRERSFDDILMVILAAYRHIETNLDIAEAAVLNKGLQGIAEDDVTMALVPGWFYNRGGISYWRPYPEESSRVIEELFTVPGKGEKS